MGEVSKRYETIFESEKIKYQIKTNILLEKVSLLRDNESNNLFVRCLFRSIAERPINALLLKINAMDIWGSGIAGVDEYQLLDLRTRRGDVFGQTVAIPMPDSNTRKVDVFIKKILYEDGSMVECEQSFIMIEPPQSLKTVLKDDYVVEQYIRDSTLKSSYIPEDFDVVWRCSCGALNPVDLQECYQCNGSKQKLIELFDYDSLKRKADEYIAIENERKEREREIKRKKEEEERKKKQEEEERLRLERAAIEAERIRKKKIKKRIILIAVLLVVICGGTYAAIWHIIPTIKYNKAFSYLENKEYDEAYDIYVDLDYKDSSQKAIETMYSKGEYMISINKYAEAADAFSRIPGYKDSDEKMVYCKNEDKYAQGVEKYNSGEFEQAKVIFSELGDYSDSQEWTKKVDYSYAEYCLNNKDYDKAVDLFQSLSSFSYLDSMTKVKEAKYQKACDLLDNKEYEKSVEIFGSLYGYSDSNKKSDQANYFIGKNYYDNKEYLKAYEILSKIKYEDSREISNKALYKLAGIEFKANRYSSAYEYYNKLPTDYKDSLEKAKESLYLLGCQYYEEQKYEKASSAFGNKILSEYEDSSDKFNESTYLYAKECYEAKKYKEASDYFSKIKKYKDSEKLCFESSYNVAVKYLDGKEYIKAIELFDSLESYKDSKTKSKEAKYQFVKQNYNNSNYTTYKYLKELKSAGYSDSKKLFNELYAWKVSVVINTSESNTTTNSSSISKYNTVYVHVKLTGGPPGEGVKLKYSYKWPGNSTKSGSWDWEMHSGDSTWFSTWLTEPWYGSSGDMSYSISTSDGTKLTSGTIKISN